MRRKDDTLTWYAYDRYMRLNTITEPGGAVTTFVYAKGGKSRTVIHPDGQTTTESVRARKRARRSAEKKPMQSVEPDKPDHADDTK